MMKSCSYRLFAASLFCLALSVPAMAQESYPVIFEAVQKAVLSAEQTGVLVRLSYDVGSRVKKGGLIAKVDTGELELGRKRSGLALKYLKSQLKDMEKLSRSGLATNEEMAKARLEMDVTKTDIEILKRKISKSRVKAPFGCIIVRRRVQPHEWVTAGQPVVDIVAPGKLRAVGNIPSHLAVGLKKGDRHDFVVNDLGVTVSGTVQAVMPVVDELSNTAQVLWKIEKPQNLMAGMKGDVRIGN